MKEGDRVKIHYVISFEDGTVFYSSRDENPVEFVIGKKQVISGVEMALDGMKEGEMKTVHLSPKEAYGEYREDLVVKVKKEKLADGIVPKKGLRLQAQSPKGKIIKFTIKDINDDVLVLDGNHPLAGKKLIMEIEFLEQVSGL